MIEIEVRFMSLWDTAPCIIQGPSGLNTRFDMTLHLIVQGFHQRISGKW